MPNMKGPVYQKRRVLYGVLQSTHVCSTNMGKHAKDGEIQKNALIRIISAYRMTSTRASQVIAGIAPIDLEIISKLVS